MNPAKAQRRTHIGPYQLLAKIGEGGMGTVHLAKMDGPAGFNKLAVVKELRADLAGSREFLQMFLDEARLAARLNHPNVIHTYGANEEQGRLYLAMEYLDGQPWSRIRRVTWERGSLPFGLQVKVLAEALAGLHYAHELRDYDGSSLQVVHCDMSPQNVFVTYDGQVKVVDFGVARGVMGQARLAPDIIVGKLAYIAPEQARGEAVDRRADVFSVGVMLWEALAGRKFANTQNLAELRRRRALGAEPRLREVAPQVPAGLASICDRALALDPRDRFATAAQFREALLDGIAQDMHDLDHVRLGELVSEAFVIERARVHALIERHLKTPSGLQSSIEDLVASLHPGEAVEHTLKADLSELASVSRLRDEVAVIEASNSASVRLARRRPRPALLGVGVAMLAAGTWFLLHQTAATPVLRETVLAIPALPPSAAESIASQTLHAATRTDTAPPTEPAPALVQLVIAANPPESVLELDGVALHKNPYAERVLLDHEQHVIRVSGAGLQSQERVVRFDRDNVVSFNLAGLHAAKPWARAPGHRPNGLGSQPMAASLAQANAVAPAAVRGSDAGVPMRGRVRSELGATLRSAPIIRPIDDRNPY